MIIVCPGCAAHYGIEREAFGPSARLVRCSACGYEWEAAPVRFEPAEDDPSDGAWSAEIAEEFPATGSADGAGDGGELADETALGGEFGALAEMSQPLATDGPAETDWQDSTVAENRAQSDRLAREFGGEQSDQRDLAPPQAAAFSEPNDDESLTPATAVAEELPPVADEGDRPPARPRRGLLMAAGAAATLGLALIVLIAAEGPISRALPGAAAVYSIFGLAPAPPGAGLEFRDVSSSREWSGSEDVLIIAGTVANVAAGARGLPPLRVALFDADRSELQAVVVQPLKPTLAEGEAVPFVARIPSPAITARRVVISFEIPSPGHG